MNPGRSLRTLLVWSLLAVSPSVAWSQKAQTVDLHELGQFGELYLNKRVAMPAAITRVAACTAKSNLGSTCISLSHNATQETVIAPKGRVRNEELLRWSKDAVPVLVTGKVELRDQLNFGGSTSQVPALIVERIERLPASITLYAPMTPDWESLGVSTRGDEFYYDSKGIESSNSKLSVWMLVNYDSPKAAADGKLYKSQISRLVYECSGTSMTTVTDSEYADSRGRGARVGARITNEREPLDLGNRSFVSLIYSKLRGLCR